MKYYSIHEFSNSYWMIKNKFGNYEPLYSKTEELTVLGNVYNNPELIEKGY